MKKCVVLIGGVFLALLVPFGEPVSAEVYEASESLTVLAGAVFYNNPVYDSVVLVEFPFTLERNQFDFFRDDTADTQWQARIFAQINVSGVDGLPVDSANTVFTAVVPNLTEAGRDGYKLFNLFSMYLRPGVYSAKLTVIDVVSKRKREFDYSQILVEGARSGRLTLGGKTLAYSVRPVAEDGSSGGSRLDRNGLHILRNPLGFIGVNDTLVYLYAELYNLSQTPETPGTFRLAYDVLDENGAVHHNYGSRTRESVGGLAVIAQRLEVKKWPSGNYRLRIIATDLQSQQVDTGYVPIRIFDRNMIVVREPSLAVVDPSADLETRDQIILLTYVLNPVERKTLDGLTPTGKKSFLSQYWAEHDSDPTTPVNEFRQTLYERYLYCNYNFSTNAEKDDGWHTDRGRIYMTYGPWDDRDDIQAPIVGDAFVIWHYDRVREGAKFVFEDRGGFQDYRLVHSNMEGEVYNVEWEVRLQDEVYKVY